MKTEFVTYTRLNWRYLNALLRNSQGIAAATTTCTKRQKSLVSPVQCGNFSNILMKQTV
jgi:hypothetical protein